MNESLNSTINLEPNTAEDQKKSWTELGPEFLVELSQKGEIDPWDVDLVFIIDKCLSQLSQNQGKQELKEAARIIFFVSVLLRIKSQNLYSKQGYTDEASSNQGEDPYGDLVDFEEIDFEEINPNANYNEILTPKALDKVLSRNPKSLKEKRKRRISLDDLLDLLKKSDLEFNQPKKKRKKSIQDFEEDSIVIPDDEPDDILDLAHDENLEEKIKILSEYVLQMIELDKQISLSQLKRAVGDWVDTFLSALFLSHSGKAELSQENFYEEIWLKRIA